MELNMVVIFKNQDFICKGFNYLLKPYDVYPDINVPIDNLIAPIEGGEIKISACSYKDIGTLYATADKVLIEEDCGWLFITNFLHDDMSKKPTRRLGVEIKSLENI